MSTKNKMKAESKNIDRVADEGRNFDKGKIELAHFDDTTIVRVRLEPRWRWSTSVKPFGKD